MAKGSKLGASHQLWQMNEINKLIWPSANGIGMIDDKAWDQTVDVALNTKNAEGTTVITKQPDKDAYTNDDRRTRPGTQLKDEDTTGSGFKPLDGHPQRGRLLTDPSAEPGPSRHGFRDGTGLARPVRPVGAAASAVV